MDRGLWEHEQRDIAAYYPEALPLTKSALRGWRLVMDPIPAACNLPFILDDLIADRTVDIGKRGSIRRAAGSYNVALDDITPRLHALRIPRRPYLVELALPTSVNGPVGPVHPRAHVIVPDISLRSYPSHPHLNSDGKGDSWACPLSPSETPWEWARGATWDYLASVAIWILKTEVWARTGGGISSNGVWIGSSMPHDPNYVLSNVRLHDPCRCGQGDSYLNCHFFFDSDVVPRVDTSHCYPNLRQRLRQPQVGTPLLTQPMPCTVAQVEPPV